MAASAHTVTSYRDTFRLLLGFAQRELHKPPTMVMQEDLDAPFIGRFLAHLEADRRNTPRSRNVRLAAIHSFSNMWRFRSPVSGHWLSGSWPSPANATSPNRSIF